MRFLLVICLLATPALTQANRSPFPTSMPGYHFQPTLAAAINEGAGNQPILLYSSPVGERRDDVPWLMGQRILWSSPALRQAIGDLPIVAMDSQLRSLPHLEVPRYGLCVLSPDGTNIHFNIDLETTDPRDVPGRLARYLRPGLTPPELDMLDEASVLQRYRDKHAELLTLLEAGNEAAALALCIQEQSVLPGGLGPRFLRHIFRVRTVAEDYYTSLPSERPKMDLLCVVEGTEGFLSALAAWGEGPIFPILYRDTEFLPQFIDEFQPGAIVLLRGEDQPVTTDRMFAAYGAALGDPTTTDPDSAGRLWKELTDSAPGVVLTHPDSPMFSAGLALAAGRRQLLALLPPADNPNRRSTTRSVLELRAVLKSLIRSHDLIANELYDELDFVTLATEQPFSYVEDTTTDRTTLAVDDAIARDEFDLPFACVGRLLGGREQALYMAMCSLFLVPERALLFGHSQIRDRLNLLEAPLREVGQKSLKVTQKSQAQSTLADWRQLFGPAGNEFELVHVTAQGNSRTWSTMNGTGTVDDLPLTGPAVVSYVHPASLRDPSDPDTIGGRWLANGAFSFFGAVADPHLDGYPDDYAVFHRALEEGQPLGMAYRLLPGEARWRPWKTMLYGDPLMRIQARNPVAEARIPAALADAVPLEDAGPTNPFGLDRMSRRVFALECLALARDTEALGAEIDSLLRIPQPELDPGLGTAVANLVALACQTDRGLPGLRNWAPALHAQGISSRRLSTVAHSLFAAQVMELSTSPPTAGEELVQLLLDHLAFDYSKRSFENIAALYRPLFLAHPEATALRNEVRNRVRILGRQRGNLRAFLTAF